MNDRLVGLFPSRSAAIRVEGGECMAGGGHDFDSYMTVVSDSYYQSTLDAVYVHGYGEGWPSSTSRFKR